MKYMNNYFKKICDEIAEDICRQDIDKDVRIVSQSLYRFLETIRDNLTEIRGANRRMQESRDFLLIVREEIAEIVVEVTPDELRELIELMDEGAKFFEGEEWNIK